MKSELLTKLGLDGIDIGIILLALVVLVLALLVIVIIQLVKGGKLKKRYEKFMQGAKAASLEEQMQALIENVGELNDITANHEDRIRLIFKKHRSSYQKIGLIKYDAFKEMGGMLSCCIAILDEDNNGIIMNNVHSSTGCYSYTKRVNAGVCELTLSPEEKISLDKALAYVSNQGEGTSSKLAKSGKAAKVAKVEKQEVQEEAYEDQQYDEEVYSDEEYVDEEYSDETYTEEEYYEEEYVDEADMEVLDLNEEK